MYYFITFMYGASEKTLENGVIDEHPSDWQKRVNKHHSGQYVLKDWKPISKAEYDLFKEKNGEYNE